MHDWKHGAYLYYLRHLYLRVECKSTKKGKAIERWWRKISGLKGKSYDSGIARVYEINFYTVRRNGLCFTQLVSDPVSACNSMALSSWPYLYLSPNYFLKPLFSNIGEMQAVRLFEKLS